MMAHKLQVYNKLSGVSIRRAGIAINRLGLGQLPFRGQKSSLYYQLTDQNTSQCKDMAFVKEIPSSVESNYDLTKDEALSFVTKTLKIPLEQIHSESHKLSLLNKIIMEMKSAVPFTNIPILIAGKDNPGYPDTVLKKCKEDVLSCYGGQCYWINSFMKHMLSLIGFETEFIGAGNRAQSLVYDLHQGVIARDVSYSGSIHLVEAGLPNPIFEAIPLDFVNYSSPYIYGQNTNKFFNCGRGMFKYCSLYQKEKSHLEPWEDIIEVGGETWKVEKEYRTAKVKPFSDFKMISELLITNMVLLPTIYQHFLIVGYPNGKLVSINQHKVTTMNEIGGYDVRNINSSQDLIETVMKYFPQFSKETLVKAVSKCN